MKKKVLVVLVVLAMIVPIVLISAYSITEFRRNSEPSILVKVPESWGEAISVARRSRSATILFSEGHIILVRIPYTFNDIYVIKIERIFNFR